MKPFNLEEAKAGKPLVTRDERKAQFIAHVPECSDTSRVIVLLDGYSSVSSYSENGVFITGMNNDEDLFMASEKRTGWINIYHPNVCGTGIYESEEAANLHKGVKCVATIHIEWEE